MGIQGGVAPLMEGPTMPFLGLHVHLWSPPTIHLYQLNLCNICSRHTLVNHSADGSSQVSQWVSDSQ